MGLFLCWTTTPKSVLLVKVIESLLAEPHESDVVKEAEIVSEVLWRFPFSLWMEKGFF